MLDEPICSQRGCKHFDGARGDEQEDQIMVCAAFPNGIPEAILNGDDEHSEPLDEQDNDTVFERD